MNIRQAKKIVYGVSSWGPGLSSRSFLRAFDVYCRWMRRRKFCRVRRNKVWVRMFV